NDELYLEFHRGCYTTHGDQKRYNRRGENLLYEAELFASLASICCDVDYPQAEIEGAWKKLLFNQFHDILPGSSIGEVYEDAKPEWQQMENTASEILKQSLHALTTQINLPQPPQPDSLPIVVFNSLNWQRSEVVSVSLPTAPTHQWQVYDTCGNQIISQLDADSQLLFLASDIPSVGYRLFWLSPSRENSSETIALEFSEQKTPSENSPETIALEFSDQKTPSENSPETIALEFSDQKTPSENLSETIALEFSDQKTPSENLSETIALQFSDQKTPSENLSETIALEFSDRHNQDSSETIALQFNDQKTPSENSPETIALQFKLENEYLRVVIDEQTGDLKSVFDKVNDRSVLSGNGNQLQAFTDKGQYWDAWNIDPNYAEHILPPLELKSIEWLEQGLLQNRLRIVRQLGESEFIQDYILQAASPVLKIATKVNWLERHVLVKAAFELNLEADFVTYEIPCGAIRRTTKPQTAAEKAKWEVPALRWADLTPEERRQGEKGTRGQGDEETRGQDNENNPNSYGVSLLNDCKYGYDAQPNQLRLSLLRSPEWPNPEADKGFHEFSYGLYPHAGSWEKAQTVKRGYEFNQPLKVVKSEHKFNSSKDGGLTAESTKSPTQTVRDKASFMDISAQNLILMAFKPTEDNPKQWILRCYECHGETALGKLTSDIGLNVTESVDLLERPLPNSELSSESKIFTIKPWKIASFTVKS
ncbi:MAG: alpha-mannosidase, partial [Rivularia sp. (in: cyanobacteria)]